jgi:hypothetical protein
MIELAMGAWLMASPWIFGHTDSSSSYYVKDLVCGGLVVALSALSWWKPASWAHYFTGGVATWLGITTWWFVERPGPPAAQNEITMAVLLVTMFLLPNQASDPPATWRDEIARQRQQASTSLRS